MMLLARAPAPSISRAPPGEAAAVRRRIEHLLATASLAPPAMLASAILIVRTMRDPLPGRLAAAFDDVRVSAEWEQAAQSALSMHLHRAARPADGLIPPDVTAVLFADRAEMLSCLARDLAARAGARWWWRALLRGLPTAPGDALAAAFCRDAQFVPAALEMLFASHDAARVLQLLGPVQALQVLTEVTHVFELPDLVRLATTSAPLPPIAGEPAPDGDQEQRMAGADTGGASSPPWSDLPDVRRMTAALAPERAMLLGVAIAARRTPLRARSERFIGAVARWYRTALATTTPATASASVAPGTPATRAIDAEASTTGHGTTPRPRTHPPTRDRTGRLRLDPLDAAVRPLLIPPPSAIRQRRGEGRSDSRDDRMGRGVPPRPTDGPHDGVGIGHESRTQLGGVLYLVNLMRYLRFPRHLESHFRVASGMSGWGWIELLARCLLGDGRNELADDPIWPALAMLDGRADDARLGAEFDGTASYRMPREWLDPIRRESLRRVRWRVQDGWLQLWHDEGFLLVTHRITAMPRRDALALATELSAEHGSVPRRLAGAARRRADARARCAPLGLELTAELQHFLALVLSYVRWRLTVSLGLGERNGDEDEAIARDVLLRTATLYVTPVHVDLVQPMDQITVSTRRAGLDADPGWVPEFGHIVRFHFT